MAALVITGISFAQMKRPYHKGTVSDDLKIIHVKPGMDSAYMNYLATDWKKEQESMKKAGIEHLLQGDRK